MDEFSDMIVKMKAQTPCIANCAVTKCDFAAEVMYLTQVIIFSNNGSCESGTCRAKSIDSPQHAFLRRFPTIWERSRKEYSSCLLLFLHYVY